MDFVVSVEGLLKFKNGKEKPPSHDDVINDLKLKKSEDAHKFSELMRLIDKVWNCEEPDDVLRGINLVFTNGFTIETLLKIIKWLFIEQDMTYWSYDGRGMLKQAIDDVNHN